MFSQDYYFIVYDTNPDRERVKYEIDANGVKIGCSYKKFLEFVRETVSLTVMNKVKATLNNYNERYILDREEGKVIEIDKGRSPETVSNFTKYKDKIESKRNDDYSSANGWVNGVIKQRDDWNQKDLSNDRPSNSTRGSGREVFGQY